MARMRTVKPEFWTDSLMVQLSPYARLLYIGMWNFALCDEGHLEDDPVRLKLQILPMDNVEIGSLLDELFDLNRLVRIQSKDGKTYLHIPTMKSQQKGDPRWKSRCPACKDAGIGSTKLSETQESFGETRRDSPKLSKVSPVEERRVEESRTDMSTADALDAPVPLRPSKLDAEFDRWYSEYPRKEAKAAARKAFVKARKTATLEQLAAGLSRYRDAVKGADRQFVALPASWLNAGRWEDEYQTHSKPAYLDPSNW